MPLCGWAQLEASAVAAAAEAVVAAEDHQGGQPRKNEKVKKKII